MQRLRISFDDFIRLLTAAVKFTNSSKVSRKCGCIERYKVLKLFAGDVEWKDLALSYQFSEGVADKLRHELVRQWTLDNLEELSEELVMQVLKFLLVESIKIHILTC